MIQSDAKINDNAYKLIFQETMVLAQFLMLQIYLHFSAMRY
jgi:hypothetical protein